MSDSLDIPPPQPFWFVSPELSADLLQTEIAQVKRLIEQHPELPSIFDTPEATVSQRKLCFALLAHREVVAIIRELFAGRYEQPPSFGEEQSKAVRSTYGLVTSDAPDWALEMGRLVEALPYHLFSALPKPLLHRSFYTNDAAKTEAIQSAAKSLNTIEELQKLIETVLDQQLERLAGRWTAASRLPVTQSATKRKVPRNRNKQRIVRDHLIAEIDDVSETTAEFIRLMDERKVKRQPTWSGWPGSWKEAYKNPRLRRLIHQDKSRALSRANRRK